MKAHLISYVLLLYFFPCFGQVPFTMDTFLAQTDEAASVNYQQQKLEFLSNTSYKIPIVKDLEFRSEFHEFDIEQQEYLVRSSFNGFKNIKAHANYHSSVIEKTAINKELARAIALKQRYDLLIDFIHFQEILIVQKKQLLLYQDKVSLLKRSISLPGFDVLDLIETETELHESQQSILSLENQIALTQQFIIQLSGNTTPPQVNEKQLLGIQKIRDFTNSTTVGNATTPVLSLALLSAETENNQLAYEWEEAKSKFSLGFIQAKYTGDSDDLFRQKLTLGLGFDIPLRSADRLDLNELQLDILKAEGRYDYALEQHLNAVTASRLQLQNSIQKYTLIQTQIEQNPAETLIEDYSKIAELSAMTLLELRESTLRKELLLSKAHYELVKQYIDYLDLTGVLALRPLKNYLVP